ncbi:MAG TPA: pyridoxamine 5'-phosphate oxidase family protein [Ktedonobacteraceae bacterium]|nr:pyridoxamine 5'-phosphate oxidase family protein [Ktedonobacteraceae bacterium]
MGLLTADMKRVIGEQRLGYVATVCEDGTPNLSPKGTVACWDDDHLVFADIVSPGTITNLRHNPAIEINVVDPLLRKGYRFKGRATVLTQGPQFEQILAFYRQRGSTSPIQSIVLIKVERALPLISPAYDTGATEEEIRQRWLQHWITLWHLSPEAEL